MLFSSLFANNNDIYSLIVKAHTLSALTNLTNVSMSTTNGERPSFPVKKDFSLAAVDTDLKEFIDGGGVKLAIRELKSALFAYDEEGVAPNYEALRELYRTAFDLKNALIEAEQEHLGAGKTIAYDGALQLAKRNMPPVDVAEPTAPERMLFHLQEKIKECMRCSDEIMLEKLPALHLALDSYFDLLQKKSDIPPFADMTDIHEATREKLFAPQHEAIIRRFAKMAVEDRQNKNDVYGILGITKDYRSTPEDHKAFRELFLSGKILRSKMVYDPPEECAKRYALYEQQTKRVMEESYMPKQCLVDMIGIRTYSVSSNELNQALREGNKDKIKEFGPYIKVVISGLNQLQTYRNRFRKNPDGTYKPVPVLRGVRLSLKELLEKGYVKGNEIDIKSFMSCCSKPNGYIKLTDKYNVQMTIMSRSAKLLGLFTLHHQSENEVLYRPAPRIRILDVKYRKGKEKDYPRVDMLVEEIDDNEITTLAEEKGKQRAIPNPQLRESLTPYFIAFRKKGRTPNVETVSAETSPKEAEEDGHALGG